MPATPLTLTAVRIAVPPYACSAHATVVADVHALLPHTSAAVSEAVAVAPTTPKLSPLIVTVSLPLSAALVADVVLTTGAAKAAGWTRKQRLRSKAVPCGGKPYRRR